jgi:hypothetical protein
MNDPSGRSFRDDEIDPIAMRFARTIEDDRERGIARLVVRMAWTLVRSEGRRAGRFSALAPEVFAIALVEAASLSRGDGNDLGPTNDFDAALMRVLSRFYAWLGARGYVDSAHAAMLADRALRIALGIRAAKGRGTHKRVA